MFVDDKFSKSFRSYLGEDGVYNFINSMTEESRYCSDAIEKYLIKELVMKNLFKNSTKSWICDNDYVDSDVKVRYHCQVTGEYLGSAHRDCNIKITLNHKMPVIFQNLKTLKNIILILLCKN